MAPLRFLPLALLGWSVCACVERPGDELPPGEERRDPAGEQRYADEVLAEILIPDRTLADSYFTRDERGFVTYRAVFAEPAPEEFANRYRALLRSRGVVRKPVGTSPHAFPSRTLGYQTYIFRTEAQSALTLRHIRFDSKDQAWLDKHPLRSAPEPLLVDGSELTLTLGAPGEWVSEVVLPDHDVVRVRELPLERYPGAVLRRVSHMDEAGIASRADIRRTYVVEHADIESIADHYASQLQRIGAKGVQRAKGLVFWSGEPIARMVKVSVAQGALSVAEGSGLSLRDILEAVPGLDERVPSDVLAFDVSIYWSEPSDRIAFLTPTDQERFQASERGKKTDR